MKSINKKILTVLVTLVLLIGLFCGTMATAYADVSGGMVAVTNQATIYTDDTELSNSAWGTVEVDGVTYSSATLGADLLSVKKGCTYVWYYLGF